jgi:uncharacterized protein YggE
MRAATTASGVRAGASLVAAIGVLVAALAIGTLAVRGLHGHVDRDHDVPTFTVNGEGHVRARATGAHFQVDLHARDATAAVSLDRLTRKARLVTQAVEHAGIAPDDIAIGDVTTSRPDRHRPSFTSETAIAIDVRDVHDVPKVVAALRDEARLIDTLAGPRFTFASNARLGERAMARAVADARRKADDAARRTGMRVAGVQSIEEGDTSIERPEPEQLAQSDFAPSGGGGGGSTTANVTVMATVAASPLATHPGAARASSDVNVVFELRPR